MSDIKTGGAAFPRPRSESHRSEFHAQQGMTLRDYFAAKALAGMLADPNVHLDGDRPNMVAKLAYDLADAMIRARGEA